MFYEYLMQNCLLHRLFRTGFFFTKIDPISVKDIKLQEVFLRAFTAGQYGEIVPIG